MNNKGGLRRRLAGQREWVKNAIIIFLAVMLVLTFFSNTIMNYSLPEVAAQYPMATSIATQVRGSGTVEATQNYEVALSETRTVSAVNVKVGDTVAAGDILFSLDKTESEELTAAKNTYNAVKLEYDKMLLGDGNGTSVTQTELDQAQSAVWKAEEDLAAAQTYEADVRWYQDQEATARNNLAAKTEAQASAQATVDSLQSQVENVPNSNSAYLSAVNAHGADSPEAIQIYNNEIAPTIASLTAQLTEAQRTLGSASSAVASAQSALESAQSATQAYQTQHESSSVSAAEAALQSAQNNLANLQAQAQDAAAEQAHNDAVAALDLAAKKAELDAAQETVNRLSAKAAASEVQSRFAGTVKEVNVAVGTTITPNEPLMVIELTGKGFTMTASVSKAQAFTLKEGMPAAVTGSYGSDINLILTSIQADKNDPANSRLLTFSVQGEDVVVGQQVSFAIGDKSAGYDIVLPSSAVHTDADGSFVYAVAVKSSPLGNRYTVKKCSVTVLASDDVNSAVSGTISSTDFVITTATTPLEVGMKVRIAE